MECDLRAVLQRARRISGRMYTKFDGSATRLLQPRMVDHEFAIFK